MLIRVTILFTLGALVAGCVAREETAVEVPSTAGRGEPERPFYQTLEVPPAPVLGAEDALESFVIAPGYRIDLVAAEPLIEDPVAADWDEDGQLYVAEMRAYMMDVDGSGEENPIGEIVRLTDTDNDGEFDQREVLLSGLVLPRALRIINDGLLVGEMGALWL